MSLSLSPPSFATRAATVGALLLSLVSAALPGAASAATSTLTVSPSQAAPGGTVALAGSNFPAGAQLVLTLDGSTTGMPPAKASASGAFSSQITVPSAEKLGAHTLRASGGGASASATLQVVAATTRAAASPRAVVASDAAASYQPSFSSSASASPNPASPGGNVTITASFTSSTSGTYLVDVELRDGSNNKIFQQAFANQSFSAGQTRTYTASLTAPSSNGTYTIKLGAFSNDWSNGYGWNDNAGSLPVGSGGGGGGGGSPTGPGYYVSCSGNDGNNGTSASSPWASINRANQASIPAGWGLYLQRGCSWYGQTLQARWNGSSSQPVYIGAYGSGNMPMIQNANANQVQITGSHITVDSLSVRSDPDSYDGSCNNNPIGYRVGFLFDSGSHDNTVQNSLAADLSVGVYFAPGAYNNHLRNSDLKHNIMMFSADPWANDGGGQAVLVEGNNNEIAYTWIHDTVACSRRYGTDGAAFEVYGGQYNTIHHNTSSNNDNFTELQGVSGGSSAVGNVYAYNVHSGSGGLTNHTGVSGTVAYNNVFYDNLGTAGGVVVAVSSSLTFKNNIVWTSGSGNLQVDGSINESNNIYWRSNGSPWVNISVSSSSKYANPGFVNPDGGNFHLQSWSPAINAGTSESVNAGWNSDLDGVSVPQNGAVDIGAYEYR